MPTWVFASGHTRGSFTAIESDGDIRECAGVDLVLGTEVAETKEEAYQQLLTKLTHALAIPAYLFKERNIICYEINKSYFMPLDLKHRPKEVALAPNPVKEFGFQKVPCKWCSKELPSNGAAQFAHLGKHLRQLVFKNLLTKEQSALVRSTALTPEVEKIFEEGKTIGAYK